VRWIAARFGGRWVSGSRHVLHAQLGQILLQLVALRTPGPCAGALGM
jgi:hypothetical protein